MINQNPLQAEYDSFKNDSWKDTPIPQQVMSRAKKEISKNIKKLDSRLSSKEKDQVHLDLLDNYFLLGKCYLFNYFKLHNAKRNIDLGLAYYKKIKKPIPGLKLSYDHFKKLSDKINMYFQMNNSAAY